MSRVSSRFVHVCISTVFGHAPFPLASRIFNLSVCKFYHRSSWQPHSTCLHPPRSSMIWFVFMCCETPFNPMLFFCIISPIKFLGASIHQLLLTTNLLVKIHENSPFFPQLQPSTHHFCWVNLVNPLVGSPWWTHRAPVGADRSTQERWSARTGADIWSSSGGSWRTSCRAWPRQSWWRKFCAATKMEGWYGWQCWAFCPWESPGEHQNSWYNDDKWVWVNTYRYITIVGWTSILTQLWLGVH